MYKELQNRFFNFVNYSDGCWEWAGYKSSGYGIFNFNGFTKRAHRVSYEFFRGEKLGKLHCCHHCDNRSCVNPFHLFIGTNQDNVDDKMVKGRHQNQHKMYCKRGHPFNVENTYWNKRNGRYFRKCRKCGLLWWKNKNK